MPTRKSVSDIKSNLLRPALSSHFEVEIGFPTGDFTSKFLPANEVIWSSNEQLQLRLMCSEATLPGSSLATLEINNDYTGVTERHAYRRIYDDRIDLTFYVDAKNYLPIRFFETWIKYIVDESRSVVATKGVGSEQDNYFYRVRYPEGTNGYVATGLKVIKFERDYNQVPLEYQFIKSFPISIQSMPVSYDSSSLLKCTVSMTYIRYVLLQGRKDDETSSGVLNSNLTPIEQAAFNYDPRFEGQFGSGNISNLSGLSGTGLLNNTGGISASVAQASGSSAASRLSQLNSIRSMQEASRLRQAGFSPGLGQGGAAGPGF